MKTITVPDTSGFTKEAPRRSITIQRLGRYSNSEGDTVRVVFRIEGDSRRYTCFYPANRFAGECLHAMLASAPTAPAGDSE